jgi:hypothetical protein
MTCANCGRGFATLREYVLVTKRVGPVLSYDAEMGDWHPAELIGSAAHANCPCGTTLTLGTEGMPLPRRRALLDWVRVETRRRGVSASALLDALRDEVRRQVLAEPNGGEPGPP